MKIKFNLLLFVFFMLGCAAKSYDKTVESVDIERFMGKWYVVAGRFTFLENGAHNAVEIYSWNEEKKQIDIDFQFNKNALDGTLKKIPQTGKIVDKITNAHWTVSPFWPLKFDYLVVGLDPDYQWTAIGVPNQKYLWIMSREVPFSDAQLEAVLNILRDEAYNIENLVIVPHN